MPKKKGAHQRGKKGVEGEKKEDNNIIITKKSEKSHSKMLRHT